MKTGCLWWQEETVGGTVCFGFYLIHNGKCLAIEVVEEHFSSYITLTKLTLLPGDPAQTALPGDPAQTALPGDPAQTALPGDPAETALPGDPTETALPGDPTETALPGDPAETALPGDPAETALPGGPGHTGPVGQQAREQGTWNTPRAGQQGSLCDWLSE